MRTWLCRVGRHHWKRERQPDAGGPDAWFERCTRCAKEKLRFGPASPDTRWI